MPRIATVLSAVMLIGAAGGAERFRVQGTALEVTVRAVPGQPGVRLGVTEVPWELLDAFVYEKPDSAATGADAVARPSKPYISMDRGFGHAGFPAISVNSDTAQAFCVWLSRRTGRTVRLPRVAELQAACAASGAAPDTWHAGRSGGKTRRVGAGKPDAAGFHDLQGNVAEWAKDEQGKVVVWGGSFQDAASEQGCDRVRRPDPEWNASDPQMPPSRWWLADGSFIGFRVAVDDASGQNPAAQRAPDSPKEKPDGTKPATP
jgi:formylglycine-generating enzyme required for sulfatase activity